MRLLYIYPEITIKGGADKVIVEKANYFATHGYDVTLITEAQMGRELSFPLDDRVRHIDMELDFNSQYHQHGLRRVLTYSSLMRTYRRKMKDVLLNLHPDIVITAMGRSVEFITGFHDGSIKIGEAHSVKANVRNLNVLEKKGLGYRLMAGLLRRQICRKVARLDALVLLTQRDADSWTEARRTVVIPNSVPFFPLTASSLSNKQVIMVARYNVAKGYEYIVEAWKSVHERHPDWVLNVYGSGELHDDVVQWIQQCHLSSSILLHEPVDDIMACYLQSSICVMSSRYEAFPMVLLESMACGVPCVSFDCPHGPRNIISNGEDGLLVEYLNPKALADGICRLIEDEPLRRRMGTNARTNILRFSREKVMGQWDELFKSLLRND